MLCFNVLSTVPRENLLTDFLFLYIYISGLKVNFSLSPLLTCVCFLFFLICWSLIGDFSWNLVTQCIFRLIGEQNGCNF